MAPFCRVSLRVLLEPTFTVLKFSFFGVTRSAEATGVGVGVAVDVGVRVAVLVGVGVRVGFGVGVGVAVDVGVGVAVLVGVGVRVGVGVVAEVAVDVGVGLGALATLTGMEKTPLTVIFVEPGPTAVTMPTFDTDATVADVEE